MPPSNILSIIQPKEHGISSPCRGSHFKLASCPLGSATAHGCGHTDWNVCNIHAEVHLASRCTRDASVWDFKIWHLASHNGNLPILRNLPRGSPLSSYNIWQDDKNSWHAAQSTPHDPLWSWLDPYLTSVPKIGPEEAVCFWVFDLDLIPLTLICQKPACGHAADVRLHTKNQVCRSIGGSWRGGYGWTESVFVDIWPWPLTFDHDFPKTGMRSAMSMYIPKIRSVGLLAAAGEVVMLNGKNHRSLLWIQGKEKPWFKIFYSW